MFCFVPVLNSILNPKFVLLFRSRTRMMMMMMMMMMKKIPSQCLILTMWWTDLLVRSPKIRGVRKARMVRVTAVKRAVTGLRTRNTKDTRTGRGVLCWSSSSGDYAGTTSPPAGEPRFSIDKLCSAAVDLIWELYRYRYLTLDLCFSDLSMWGNLSLSLRCLNLCTKITRQCALRHIELSLLCSDLSKTDCKFQLNKLLIKRR